MGIPFLLRLKRLVRRRDRSLFRKCAQPKLSAERFFKGQEQLDSAEMVIRIHEHDDDSEVSN